MISLNLFQQIKYCLTFQMRRSSLSIAINIAEECGLPIFFLTSSTPTPAYLHNFHNLM
ncbi:MAG: four helix bundle protein [Chitinophagaceae bacterium]